MRIKYVNKLKTFKGCLQYNKDSINMNKYHVIYLVCNVTSFYMNIYKATPVFDRII